MVLVEEVPNGGWGIGDNALNLTTPHTPGRK
jgi:phenylpyruvate tautomerase PptA (4-oxalocrotonate tautomerase family)